MLSVNIPVIKLYIIREKNATWQQRKKRRGVQCVYFRINNII